MIRNFINKMKKHVSLTGALLALFLMTSGVCLKAKPASKIKSITSFSLDFKKKDENKDVQIKGSLKEGSLLFKKEKTGWFKAIHALIPADGKKRTFNVDYEITKLGEKKSKLQFVIKAKQSKKNKQTKKNKAKQPNKKKSFPKPLFKKIITKVGAGTLEQSIVFKKDPTIKYYEVIIGLGGKKQKGMEAILKSVSLK